MHVICFLPSQPQVAVTLGILSRNIKSKFIELSEIGEVKKTIEQYQNGNEKVLLFTEYLESNSIENIINVNSKIAVIMLINKSVNKFVKNIDLSYVNCFIAHEGNRPDPRELAIMMRKFSVNDIAGLEKYLGYGAILDNYGISNPDQKQSAIAVIEDFVLGIGGKNDCKRFKEYSRKVCELVDELVLNALSDSELGDRDPRTYANFSLPQNQAIQVSWGFDGETFGISVRDINGKIKKQTILKYLSEATANSLTENDANKKAFGIRIAFEKMHTFIVNNNPGNFTEIICLLSFEKRFRDFESKLKSFHYFSL